MRENEIDNLRKELKQFRTKQYIANGNSRLQELKLKVNEYESKN